MNIQDQVNTEIQGCRLEELGITAKPIFCHCRVSTNVNDSYVDILPMQCNLKDIPDEATTWIAPAFTVGELGLMLGEENLPCFSKEWDVWLLPSQSKFKGCGLGDMRESVIRAELLIKAIENKLLTPSQCNERLNK